MTDPVHLKFAVLAADVALFTLRGNELLVRLIPVDRPPFFVHSKGLPGGLIDPKETAEEAALRLLESKGAIAVSKIYLEQLYTFSAVERDPRGRVVAVAYLALVPWENLSPSEQGSEDAWWSTATETASLAYDHDEVLGMALRRLRSRIRYTTILSKLMPETFTLTELEQAYESVLGVSLDKRNFRKKILKIGVLKELDQKRSGGPFRPAQLYSFATKEVREIEIIS